ncbi:MAG: hypothetical protein IOMNBAOH_01873 [Rhodocyclaceae bacterium]|nr:hypothetical protein [Rhodocyclaceae bacterium]
MVGPPPDALQQGIRRARTLAHQPHAVPEGDHGLPVTDFAGRARGVHESRTARCDRDGFELDRLRDPPRAGADDGGMADGGYGQAQFQAADRSVDRGVGGAERTDLPGTVTRLGQHHPGQGVPGRCSGDDRGQQRGRTALDAGAVSVPRRGRRLSTGRRGRRRCDLAGGGAHANFRSAQDLHRVDADDLGGVGH